MKTWFASYSSFILILLLTSGCGPKSTRAPTLNPSLPSPDRSDKSPAPPAPPPPLPSPQVLRQPFITSLWRSPLGEMFRSYLFEQTANAQVPQAARAVVNRLFAQPRLVPTRVVALQLLTEDLYVSHQMTADVDKRILILEGAVSERRLWRNHAMEVQVAQDSVPFLVMSLPFGSPVIREETLGLLRRAAARLQRLWSRSSDPVYSAIRWNRIFSQEVFKGYEFYMGGQVFLNTYGPFSTVYYFAATYFFNSSFDPDQSYAVILSGDELLSGAP